MLAKLIGEHLKTIWQQKKSLNNSRLKKPKHPTGLNKSNKVKRLAKMKKKTSHNS